jgi:hypothetical protein
MRTEDKTKRIPGPSIIVMLPYQLYDYALVCYYDRLICLGNRNAAASVHAYVLY